jgi:hypothetical protein
MLFGSDLDAASTGEELTVTALEFDVVWEHLGFDEMPVVLRVPSPGATRWERADLVRSAWESLQAKGYGRQVDLDPRLHGMLSVLARPDAEVDGRLWHEQETRLLAAARGEAAVLAAFAGDTLTLRQAAPTGLVREALGMLPAKPAGSGRSVTLPAARFESAAAQGATQDGFEAALRGQGVRPDDARQLREMIGDLQGHGQFGAAARDHWGGRRRADHVVGFFDTAAGRYLQVRRGSAAEEPWSTLSPADSRRMHQHVEAMYQDAVAAAR